MPRRQSILVVAFLVSILAACGGGGGRTFPQENVAVQPPGASQFSLRAVNTANELAPTAGYGESITIPSNDSKGGTLSVTPSLSLPDGVSPLPSGFGMRTTFLYFAMTASNDVTFAGSPTYAIVSPPSVHLANVSVQFALYDPARGWIALSGATISAQRITMNAPGGNVTMKAGQTYTVVAYSPQDVVGCPTPPPTPTPSPTHSPTPTPSPTLSPTPTPSPTHSPTPTPSPTHSPTPSPSPTPTATPAAARLYVVNTATKTVSVFDEQGHKQTTTGAFPGLSGPIDITYSAKTNLLYVTDENTADIKVFDLEGHAVHPSGSFSTGSSMSAPDGITFDPFNNRFYVSNFGDVDVVVFDINGNPISVAGNFGVTAPPGGITFDNLTRHFYTTICCAPPNVVVADESGHSVSVSGTFPGAESNSGAAPGIMGFDPTNRLLYDPNNASSGVKVFNETGHAVSVTGTFPGTSHPEKVLYDPHNGLLYVTNVSSNKVTVYTAQGAAVSTSGTFPGLSGPWGITVAP
ncbi:MAG: hypothetical protein JO165_05380 [Candidatus Eremiobacteraeota bacterium]|nr:hypothetical protein [Candidatus Eremiobacteraeota bacterium]